MPINGISELSGPETVQARWPFDGPHDDDTVSDAAAALPALVRYLNNATQYRSTMTWAATTYRTVSGVASAIHGLDQLLRQLVTAMEQQVDDPTLYDDRRDRPGAQAAIAVAIELEAVRATLQTAAGQLDVATSHAVHLGNEEPLR